MSGHAASGAPSGGRGPRTVVRRLVFAAGAAGLLAGVAGFLRLSGATVDGPVPDLVVAAVLAGVVLATVTVLGVVAWRLLRPLGTLTDAADRLAAGDPDVRVAVRGSGEVADLTRALNTIAPSAERRREQLVVTERSVRASEHRLRSVVEGVEDHAIVLLDVLGDIRSWNRGAQRVTGWDESDVVGRSIASLAERPDVVADALPEATRTGRAEAEGWYRRPDGTRYWAQLTVTALRGDDGAPYGYAAILQDVTDRWAAREALEQALQRERDAAAGLRHANELKDEFLAVAAHEMRTPLSAILGATHLLAPGPDHLGPAEVEEVQELIWRHANDMHDIVERLLDFTELQAGRIRVEPREVDLREELERAVGSVDRLLVDHEVVVGAPSERVTLDPALLQQVLTNLLSNAAKFSAAGTAITVRGAVTGSCAVVAVADEGEGIAPEDHERVFELFRQAEHAAPTARGIGVGLAIVRRYVELAGGRIHLDSLRGQGATFTVELPLAPPASDG